MCQLQDDRAGGSQSGGHAYVDYACKDAGTYLSSSEARAMVFVSMPLVDAERSMPDGREPVLGRLLRPPMKAQLLSCHLWTIVRMDSLCAVFLL